MEVKRADAEQSAAEALASENDAETAQVAAEAARDASIAARDLSQTYANQAFQTTPTVIQQGILISQLHGSLFDGEYPIMPNISVSDQQSLADELSTRLQN